MPNHLLVFLLMDNYLLKRINNRWKKTPHSDSYLYQPQRFVSSQFLLITLMNTSIDYIQVLILTEFCVNSERVITRHKTAFLNPGVSKELRNVPGLQRKTALGGDRIYML